MEQYDILIVGGGAAGIGAASECGQTRVLLADRGKTPGGVLLQCAHRGFGAGLNGSEYAADLCKLLPEGLVLASETTVLALRENKTALLADRHGRYEIGFSQLILATGAREIPAGALSLAGTRPRGVYTAGDMQKRMNCRGEIPEGPVVILGGGDLGLIMAAQLAEAGLAVTVVEREHQCSAMARNRRCLQEYPIRLLCENTITELFGERELEEIFLADGSRLPCKTLLIAVGLVPERQLTEKIAAFDGLRLCGNCNRVHSMIESVVQEGKQAGRAACERLKQAYDR